jgi:prepilin-type N-terminal cleavage/methylation domain-containing protein
MVTHQPRKQAGYTLVELLIVIMIALLLMVVSLPTIKSVMEDARPREASRILNTMIFTAKARAAQFGNPVGIEFVYDQNAVAGSARCTQMYMCEIPPIYAGDITDARVTVNTSMTPWEFTFPGTSAGFLTSLLDSSNQFQIRINHRGPWYPVIYQMSRYRFDQTRWEREHGGPIPPAMPPPMPPTSDPNGYGFQIRRPPVRVGNPVELPKSTAIDMTYSGMGLTGTQFSSAAALRVLFAPSGHVESYTLAGGDTLAPTGTLHFLVGLAAKVNPPVDTVVSPQANVFDIERSNLADANALWVSVGRSTGIVTTNENAAAPSATLDASDSTVRTNYLQACREYATNREQKGGR